MTDWPARLKMEPDAPQSNGAVLVMGFSGWMDGGNVSTGAIDWLAHKLDAEPVASLKPEGFYVYNMPGSMEMVSMFRPHVRIVDGVVEAFDEPENMFQLSRDRQFLLFNGKEPNMDWAGFAECIFAMADRYGVRRMFFVGSVSGLVPHTRDPRLFSSISHPELKDEVARFGLQLTNYEGPGSFITQLMVECRRRELPLITVVAEVPAYVAGNNIRCIESVVRTLSAVTSSPIDFDDLRVASDELEKRISDAVAEKPELAGHIRKLEEQYDNEVFDTQMGDLKDWLEDQGIVLD